ncbi:MAG TPA: DUF1549 and DUF1553 domain-containing protein [Steroidobacter sp.]|uniref:DUF1549 and DUF1553 domain-containing protein n=1 Tax=Steroidobacter sp. TaxID=1978227 RepID=UPI002ED951D2
MSPLRKAALALALSSGLFATALAADSPDAEKSARAAPAPHWAYQPVQRPDAPKVRQKKWARTPIDKFVLAQLESKQLGPSADADRATFIRRATLDAIGIVPTPEEVEAFVNDRSPKAYEKLIDRLLASPHYGERQARRWLDLARYADSDGYNADGTRPNMWRYRDYVIEAFNRDKPYDQFIKEQLAGDELRPDSNEALIATGFLRSYPDEINARDLNLKKQEIATDLTDTVGAVFLAQTVGCANCHNHKFDAISQKEYFQLQAYFVNASARDDVMPLKDNELSQYRQKLAAYEAATQSVRTQMDAILQPIVDKLEADRVFGFVPATRDSITKPEEQRDAYDRWIYHRSLWTMVGRTRNAENRLKEQDPAAHARYQELKQQLAAFDSIKPTDPGNISTIVELGPESPPTHILANGIYDRRLDVVEPGVPVAFAAGQPNIVPTATSSGRRTALANWIASENNPLTARVFVNRVWNQFFGHGIVDTVSDFGKMGERSINPQLLDYLAYTFVHEHGWSVKKLQRQIMLSRVYRQSSAHRPDAYALDPHNRLLWSFPRQRLDAEQIRDSLLASAGLLQEKMGGPAVFPPVPGNFGANPNAWTVSNNPEDHHRRSVYVFIRRNTAYPLLETFDMANPNSVHSRRDVTTTAPQALALINSDLVYGWSQALASRVVREAGASEDARIDRLFRILFSRGPDAIEKQKLIAFLDSQEQINRQTHSAAPAEPGMQKVSTVQISSPQDPRESAFVDLVHAVANSNEFSYRF